MQRKRSLTLDHTASGRLGFDIGSNHVARAPSILGSCSVLCVQIVGWQWKLKR